MATKLYLHAATSTVVGTLPSVSQHSRHTIYASIEDGGGSATNRSMDTTIGTTQKANSGSVAFAKNGYRDYYVSRFVSPPLVTTGITAQTWTVAVAAKEASLTNPVNTWPINTTSAPCDICLYIWRPSTGAAVGTIFENLSSGATANTGGKTAETGLVSTFSGGAVTAQAGDVIIYEWICRSGRSVDVTDTVYAYYDGTTEPTDNVGVSSAASYISTPQTITFQAGENCTVTGKTFQSNFCTHVA